jgi:(R,R)-butanediol dehydrogenase/meso-butanediol dehydrogenase/diacetyl reductase
MPAAVHRGPGRVEVEQLPVPSIAAGDALVEVSHCGICGSDLHFVIDGWGAPGGVHGHEWSGVIREVGRDADAAGWSVGDRVVGGPARGCGRCGPCDRGRPNLCLHKDKAGVSPHQGAFALFKASAASSLYRVPDGVDLRTAALTEPLAVAHRGVERSGAAPGVRALVTGGGPIGILTVVVLRALGVDDVTVSEPAPLRRARAEAVGATSVVAPDELPAAPPLPMDLVDEPFDVAFDCSGRADAMEAAHGLLGRGGTLVLSGTGMRRPRFDPNRIILNELVVTGTVEYTPADYERCLELLASGTLPVDLLLEPRDVPLSGVQSAMEQLAAGELAGKVLVVPREA